MKAAFLTASASRMAGGMFVSARRLAQTLGRMDGVEVAVLALRDEHAEADLPAWQPVSPQVFDSRGPRAFGYSPALRRQLGRISPDVLHLHGLWMYPSLACVNWHRQSGHPSLISPRGMLEPWALNNSRWKKRVAGWVFENRNLRTANCLHALCAAEGEGFRRYGLRNPIAVIPNGIDPAAFERLPGRAVLEDRFPALRNRRWVLFLSRIHPKKGLPHLLRAWASVQPSQLSTLNSQHSDWLLVIAGPDEVGHEAEMKRLAVELGLEQAVCFTGPLHGQEKLAALGNSELFVLPSFSEGFSMAILEAAAAGLPVLLSPPCNFPELAKAGAAIEVSPHAAGCEAGLREVLGLQDAERRAMGERGRSLVMSAYTWPRIASQMLEVYRWLLQGGSPPACVRLD